ncbi:MAG: helix-turn-helix domain-containing protein [Candidatus Komeilibacteria bacterium]|nr:helix-turn-helix domain-containing protein [Candidatus Komeilibacteria bacterium]
MTSFITKTLNTPFTLPELLQKSRTNLQWSLGEAAERSSVPEKYLRILEAGAYHLLPGEIYAKSFLKKYADCLKLQTKVIIKMYQAEKATQLSLPAFLPPQPLAKKIFTFSPRFFTAASLTLGIMACLTYIGWQLAATYRSPNLAISYPQNNLITVAHQIMVTGFTEPEIVLQINHERILLAPDGSFNQPVDLQEGLNQITIEAKKKHSQPTSVDLSVFRQAEAATKPEPPSPHS